MENVKSALSSKTLWGAVIAILGAGLTSFGFDSSMLGGMDGEIVTFFGSAFAIYGRIVAIKKIG